MKILLIGSNGQVGRELFKLLTHTKHHTISINRDTWDMAVEPLHGEDLVASHAPDLVICASAYTNVGKAEVEPEAAYAVNAEAPRALALGCQALNIPILHLSTDFVFSGQKEKAYLEVDQVQPINVYGASKAKGEAYVAKYCFNHIIIRTSWVYSSNPGNFVTKIIDVAGSNKSIPVVDDQVGTPTFAADLAAAIVRVVDTIGVNEFEQWGIYNYSGDRCISRYDFSFKILELALEIGLISQEAKTVPIKTSNSLDVQRPANSCLDNQKIYRIFSLESSNLEIGLKKVLNQLIGVR